METSPEGPFDGIIGFSEGALVAADVILHQAKTDPPHPLKVGIFVCGAPPWDYANHKSLLSDESEERISVPTLSIVGTKDVIAKAGNALFDACEKGRGVLMEWDGGHEVPRAVDVKDKMVQKVRRTINRARMMG